MAFPQNTLNDFLTKKFINIVHPNMPEFGLDVYSYLSGQSEILSLLRAMDLIEPQYEDALQEEISRWTALRNHEIKRP